MPWTEQQPGLHQRPLGENERFIKLIGDRAHALGREHWSVTSKATFTLQQKLDDEELEQKCRAAWIATRFEHPSIASKADETLLNYEVPNQKSLESWARETFVIYRENLTTDDLVSSLKPADFVTAHLLLSESTIFLHFPHWRTDGYGALHLLNSFLQHLSSIIGNGDNIIQNLTWGQEVPRLLPGVEDALGLPEEPSQEIIDAAKRFLSTAALIRGAVGLQARDGVASGALPQGTRHTNLQFSHCETRGVQSACKSLEIDVLAAIQASCAAVTYAEADADAKEKPFTSTIRLSLRSFMPEPYDGAAYAAGICTGGYFEQVPHSQSWLDNARQYTRAYDKGVTPDFLQTRRQYAKEVLGMMQQKPAPPPVMSSEIDISSVSDTDQLVASHHEVNGKTVLEVRNIGVGVETLTRQMYCFVWTFRGQLELSLVWNEAFYDATYATRLVSDIRKVLVSELKL